MTAKTNNWSPPEANRRTQEELMRLKRQARYATWHASKNIAKWTLIGVGAYAIVKAAQQNNQDHTEY